MDDFIEKSSGNVYKDLGYANPESMQMRASIVIRIRKIMEERRLTQKQVSDLTGIPQSKISNILNGQFRGVSEYRLLDCLAALGNDLEIRVRPTNGEPGKIAFA